MIDYILTILILVILGLIALYGNKASNDQSGFMSKQYTTMLKAICCIIVIFVHIPLAKQNKIQDGIGSFAYICVTIFFMISAYGMILNTTKKVDYLKHFWRNRLAVLLIPQVLINIFDMLLTTRVSTLNFLTIFNLNKYVIVLLCYYIYFWFVYQGRSLLSQKTINTLLMVGIVMSSLFSYFYIDEKNTYWCFERFGLLYGLIIFLLLPNVKRIINPNTKRIIFYFIICIIFGIAYLKFKNIFFWGEFLLRIILGLSTILLIFTLTSKRTFGNQILNYLGNISYEVYLSHGFIITLIMHYKPDLSSGIFIVLTIISTIIFSSIIHIISTPLIKMIRSK